MHFGACSTRLPEEQLQLGYEAIEHAIAKADAEAKKRDPEQRKDNAARRRGRGADDCGRWHLTVWAGD
jgi:hypothetical protein